MKAKQVYDSIDQSKATKEVNAFLEKVKTATKNFTVENEAVDKKMNELYEKIKETKPDILKGYKEPKAAKEPKAPRATTSKPRTPRAKKPARKATVSSVAKKIRKKGESWNDALKRASSVFKEQQEDKRLKSREAMQELQKFMNDSKFKNWPRTYGKEKASGNDLMRDNARKAKAPGKRVSKSGRVYWENRDNRSDREASAFPRKIYLKDGGDLEYRTHNLFELGGEVMVEPTILQNNPDYITSTATMSDYFEKGGMMAKGWGTPSQIEDDLRTQIINLFIYNGISDKLEDIIYTDQSTDKGIKWQIEVVGKDTDIIHAFKDGKSRGQYEWYLNNKRSSKADIQQYFLDKYISDNSGASNIFAKRGYVAVSEKDGYWYIISKPTSKEEAQQVIDMGVPRGEMGKVVTIEEAKANKEKIIGREYLEEGGKLKYDPSRDVEAIVIKDGPFPMLFKKDDFIGGAYQMEKGGLSENYYYFSPRSILFARLKTGEEIKPVNGFWIKKNATGIVYVEEKAPVKAKKKSALGVSVPRPIMVSGNRHKDEKLLKMLNDFTASDALRPAFTFVALKDGDIVATDAARLIRLIDGSTAGMNEGVCMKKLCSGYDYKDLKFPSYNQVIQGLSFNHSEDYDLTDLYQKVYAAKKEGMAEYDSKRRNRIVVVELELKNETISLNAELLLSVIAGALKLGWKNAFISYTPSASRAIVLTEERPSPMRGFAGKDLILLMPMFSGGDFPTKKVKAEEVFELGGEVMVEPTILQNNPDYITSTATMSDYFENGGIMADGVTIPYTKNFLKGMQSIKVNGLGGYMPGVRNIYWDKKDEKFYFKDFSGDYIFEIRNGTTLKEIDSLLKKSKIELERMADGGMMAKGGYVAVSENNGYWYIMSTPSSKEKAQQVIDMGVPRGEVGKVVTLEQAKAYNKVIGREYLEKGGGIYSSDKAWSVKVMLDDQPVDSFMVRGRNLKEARMMVEDYHEAKMEAKYGDDIYFEIEEAMAKGGKLSNGKYNFEKGDEGMYEGNEVRVVKLDTSLVKYNYDILDEDGNVQTQDSASKEKFERQFAYFPKMAKGGGLEGKKRFDEMFNVGRAKYVVSFHDGVKKHNDGSDFFDLRTFKNKKDLEAFKKELLSNGYLEQSITDGGVMSKGGALEHMIFKGDKIRAIHRNMVIVESDLGSITVLDFRTEPLARRILVEPITGKNTLASAIDFIDADPSFKTTTMAMGGSLYTHGLEEGDLIVEDEGAYINVLSEDGKIYYVDLGKGERSTEPPLPFEHGGEVKIGDIARLAAMYNKTGQEVAAAISEGADVEVEHTEDRKKAMRIAVDHLEEDFYYYPKLKAVENKPDFSDYYEKGGEVPEEFLDSKGVRKIDPKSIKELTDFVMALPQTKSVYFNEVTGEYVPSRKKLHAEIINTFKKDVVCITKDQPIAIFMGGSPASGKSSFLRKYSPYLLKEEILKVDADEIRAMLPEYQGYNAAQTHSETKDIVSTLLSNKNIGIPCDFDLIYDGTMNSVKSYIPLMDILRKRGYKIFIVYMDKVPKDVIIKRALERYQKSGRFVPLEVIEDFFEKGRTAFDDLKKDVDGYMVIDGSNQDYEIIERGGMKLPTNREYSKLGTKIDRKDIPVEYKRGGMTKKA